MADWKDLLSTFDTVLPSEKRNIDDLYSSFDNIDTRTVCKKDLSQNSEGYDQFEPEYGIVFTNINVLADKFFTTRDLVLEAINDFINKSSSLGNKKILIDISAPEFSHYIARNNSWHSYHECLYDYCKERDWNTDIRTSLFIIGGDDVIATPRKVFTICEDDYRADIDLLYCFPDGFDIIEEMGNYVLSETNPDQDSLCSHLISCAKFNVSRLPLPQLLPNRPRPSIGLLNNYFDKVISSHSSQDIQDIFFSSAREFKTASACMSQGLHIVATGSIDGFNEKGVYQCPSTSIGKNTHGKVIDNISNVYIKDLCKSDLLLFNVHGSDYPSLTGYYGYGHTEEQYTAFDTYIPTYSQLNDYFRGKIILTCACFGARYFTYGDDESILFKAIYESPETINFVGSSTVAWGGSSEAPDYKCSGSETFIRILSDYILNGFSIGEAFMRAKLDYLSHFYLIEDLEITNFTICEFNLFGDPMFHYNYNKQWQEFPRPLNQGIVSKALEGERNTLKVATASVLDTVYTVVRNAVDNAMSDIARMLEDKLTKEFDLDEVRLKSIEKKTIEGQELGYKYCFKYNWKQEGRVIAKTDKKGNIKGLFISK